MSYWELLKKAINKHKPGDFIYRTELVEKTFGASEHYLDSTRRQLTVCGYLADTGKPGRYKLLKPVEMELTVSKLRKMYDTICYSKKCTVHNQKLKKF